MSEITEVDMAVAQALREAADEVQRSTDLSHKRWGNSNVKVEWMERAMVLEDAMLLRDLASKRDGSEHVDYVCETEHEDGGWSCQFCEGGLFACAVCDSFEGATTTDCPGVSMTEGQINNVYAGTLDYYGGKWVAQYSMRAPNWFEHVLGPATPRLRQRQVR